MHALPTVTYSVHSRTSHSSPPSPKKTVSKLTEIHPSTPERPITEHTGATDKCARLQLDSKTDPERPDSRSSISTVVLTPPGSVDEEGNESGLSEFTPSLSSPESSVDKETQDGLFDQSLFSTFGRQHPSLTNDRLALDVQTGIERPDSRSSISTVGTISPDSADEEGSKSSSFEFAPSLPSLASAADKETQDGLFGPSLLLPLRTHPLYSDPGRFRPSTGSTTKRKRQITHRPIIADQKQVHFNTLHQFNVCLKQLHQTFKTLQNLQIQINQIRKKISSPEHKELIISFLKNIKCFSTHYLALTPEQKKHLDLHNMKYRDSFKFEIPVESLFEHISSLKEENIIYTLTRPLIEEIKIAIENISNKLKTNQWVFETERLTGNTYILGTIERPEQHLKEKFLCASGMDPKSQELLLECLAYFNLNLATQDKIILSASPTQEFMNELHFSVLQALKESLDKKEMPSLRSEKPFHIKLEDFANEMQTKTPTLLQKILLTLQTKAREAGIEEDSSEIPPTSGDTKEEKAIYFKQLNILACKLAKHFGYDKLFENKDYASIYVLSVVSTPNCAELAQQLLESKQLEHSLENAVTVGFTSFKQVRRLTHQDTDGLKLETDGACTFERKRCAACEARHNLEFDTVFNSPEKAKKQKTSEKEARPNRKAKPTRITY